MSINKPSDQNKSDQNKGSNSKAIQKVWEHAVLEAEKEVLVSKLNKMKLDF